MVEALEGEGVFLGIDPQEVQQGGVKVADVDGVLCDLIAEGIGLTVMETGFYASTRHPKSEGVRVVVASGELAIRAAAVFLHGRAAEFAGPNYQCVLEQTALFQVGEEGGDRLVDLFALSFEADVQCIFFIGAVRFPAPI